MPPRNFTTFHAMNLKPQELPQGRRSDADVLRALRSNPVLSSVELQAYPWLRNTLRQMQQNRLIDVDPSEGYPLVRYDLTSAGLALINR